MSMRNIMAIIEKQWKDTLKNKEVLIQFMLFPLLTVVMEHAVVLEQMPEHFFVTLFSTMYIGMAPLTSMASIIAEEKEKHTLRVLIMSDVKAAEYLVGVGSYVWLACMLGSIVMAVTGGYRREEFAVYLGIMCMGIFISLVMGAVIGIWSQNQMAATSVALPVMIVFSFLPMIALFNESIAKISRFTYSQQVYSLLNRVGDLKINKEMVFVILIHLAVVLLLFNLAYRRRYD